MTIRYIKLGDGGKWEKRCIEEEQTIRLAYHSELHNQCLNDDWDAVHDYWLKERKGKKRVATNDVNQIKAFYKAPEDDLWVTFYKRHLYWCRVTSEVIEVGDKGDRIRKVKGAWSCEDMKGRPLTIENLDGRVPKTQGFRGTICKIDTQVQKYLLNRIKGNLPPEVKDAKDAKSALKKSIQQLVSGLWFKDFELLVDLIFSRLGWQRVSLLGKTEKDIDLDVRSPITKKRACVQVKSSTSVDEIKRCFDALKTYTQYHEKYFVFHTLTGNKEDVEREEEEFILWDADQVAEMVIQAGLIDWLIEKRS